MKKLNFLLVALFLIAFKGFSQDAPTIEFKELNHDFGTFKEEAGPQKFRFIFTNKGKAPLTVSNVQASCGCTTPAWTKEPIAPGATGFVEAEYNPQGRPGAFNKSLTVTSNAATPTTVLTIKGIVTERVKTPADLYPRKFGDIRLVSEYLNMGRVSPSKESKQSFKVYNDGEKDLTFKQLEFTAKHLKGEIKPLTIKPKETAEITVEYDGKIKNDWGYSNDPFELTVTGSSQEKVQLYVVATIEEEKKKLSPADSAKAPRMSFLNNKIEHNFGDLKQGDVVNTEFVFTNTGKETLTIYKTKASCGCTASDPAKKVLAPGETSNIKVTFNSAGKHEGDQHQSVTIYSNDPFEPTRYLTIKGKVVIPKAAADDLTKTATPGTPAEGAKAAPAPVKEESAPAMMKAQPKKKK